MNCQVGKHNFDDFLAEDLGKAFLNNIAENSFKVLFINE